MRKFEEANQNILVFHQDNSGQLAAREKGIEIAKSIKAKLGLNSYSYVSFVDSDDFLKVDYLKTLDALIRKNNYPDIVGFGFDRVSLEGKIIKKYNSFSFLDGVITEKKKLIESCLSFSADNAMWKKIVKIELFEKKNCENYDVRLGEDIIASYQLYKNCSTAVWSDIPIYNYTFNPFSISNLNKQDEIKVLSTVMSRLWKSISIDYEKKSCDYLYFKKKVIQRMILTLADLNKKNSDEEIKAKLLEAKNDSFWRSFFESLTKDNIPLYLLKCNHLHLAMFTAKVFKRFYRIDRCIMHIQDYGSKAFIKKVFLKIAFKK